LTYQGPLQKRVYPQIRELSAFEAILLKNSLLHSSRATLIRQRQCAGYRDSN
jgi:hypothetical protein